MTMDEPEETRDQTLPDTAGDPRGVHPGGGAEIDEFGIPVLTEVLGAEEHHVAAAPAPEGVRAGLSEALEQALPDLLQESVEAAVKRLTPKIEAVLRKELSRRIPEYIDAAVGTKPEDD